MGSPIPGKLMVVVAVFLGLGLFFWNPGGNFGMALWGLAIILAVIGVINWGVR